MNVRDDLSTRARKTFEPLTRALLELGVTPNQLTVTGALVNLLAALFVVFGWMVPGGIVYLLGSAMDMFDGSLARLGKMTTPFGAYLDSTLDRASEGVMLAAIAYHFSLEGDSLAVGMTVIAALASFLVSYTRARAEILGIENKGGLLSRPERVVLLGAGLVIVPFWSPALATAIYVMAILGVFTVIQRVVHTHKALQR